MFKRLLVPLDGSDCATDALRLATDFAKDQQATLILCTVIDLVKPEYTMAFSTPQIASGLLEALHDESKIILENAANVVAGRVPVETFITEGIAVDAIVEAAQTQRADLIVMGSHGRSGFSRLFLGSVAEGVLRTTHVPVLIDHYRAAAATSRVEPATAAKTDNA